MRRVQRALQIRLQQAQLPPRLQQARQQQLSGPLRSQPELCRRLRPLQWLRLRLNLPQRELQLRRRGSSWWQCPWCLQSGLQADALVRSRACRLPLLAATLPLLPRVRWVLSQRCQQPPESGKHSSRQAAHKLRGTRR